MTHGSATVPDPLHPLHRDNVGAGELPLPRELEPVAFAMRRGCRISRRRRARRRRSSDLSPSQPFWGTTESDIAAAKRQSSRRSRRHATRGEMSAAPLISGRSPPAGSSWPLGTRNRRLVGRQPRARFAGEQQSESGAIVAAELLRRDALSLSGCGGSRARRPARCTTRAAWPHRRVGVQERMEWFRRLRTGSPTCVRASQCRPAVSACLGCVAGAPRPLRHSPACPTASSDTTPLTAISAVLDRRTAACRLELGTTMTGIVVGSIRDGAKPQCR